MANKSKKTRNIVIGICTAIIVIALIVVVVILGTRNGGFGGLNDSYFVSDDSKLVLDMDPSTLSSDDEKYMPTKVRLVYTYSGDSITSLKAYYEYKDASEAKSACDYLAEALKDEYKSISQDGVYVIVEANESEYENVSTDDVKQQIEFIEMIKGLNINNSDEESEIENVDISEELDTQSNEETETEE